MPEAALRIGHFRSTPWIPFYQGSETWPGTLVPCVSSQVGRLASAGALDATPMATVDWLARRDAWTRLAPFGLAYRQRAASVLFFSQDPIETLDGAAIAISAETATSVRVLRALLMGRYGLRPGPWRRGADPGDACTPRLLIQDEAIEEASRGRFRHVYDLGEQWWAWQRTPIVSAVWVCRADLGTVRRRRLLDALAASLAQYQADPGGAIERHARWTANAAPPAELRRVLDNFEFALGAEAECGIARMAETLPGEIDWQD